jgi:hypothetical protein
MLARAKNNSREDVAAKLVGAKPVGRAGRGEARGKILRGGVGGRDPRRGKRDDDEKQRQRQAPAAATALLQEIAEATHSRRTRGSTSAYTRSVIRFTKT